MTNASLLIQDLTSYFKSPEIPFGGLDAPQIPADAMVVLFGVPFDGTATYHGGAEYGPWAIRDTSAKQIETYSRPKRYTPYMDVGIVDLGNFDFGIVMLGDNELIYTPPLREATEKEIRNAKQRVNRALRKMRNLTYITRELREKGKVPLMLGGEHLVSLFTLRGVAHENPVLLHFDAHGDNKAEYLGVRYSHTTPIYHLVHGRPRIPGRNIMQIGIRQGSDDEFENAEKAGIRLYEALDENFESLFDGERFMTLKEDIRQFTEGRKVAITFDIDALDAAYTPFTGTPYAGGMTPAQACQLIGSIAPNAEIIYLDFVETASDGKNTMEGSIATQIILDAMLAHRSLRR